MNTVVTISAKASEIGILPPDLDYQKICKAEETIQKDDFDWTGKTPASSGLPDTQLIKLAELYYNGSGLTPPDYNRAREIVEYLIENSENFSNAALFIKYQMLIKGLGYPQNTNMATEILNALLKKNDSKAHSRLGDQLAAQREYTNAADHYRKSFVAGEPTAALSLAYLYHDKKIPGTQEDIDKSIVIAQDAAVQYLMRGNCHALTLIAMMYRRLNDIPKSEYYSAHWFEKAAMLNDPLPKLYLAYIIQRGFVFKYDEKRVLKLWNEAADLGSDQAMFLLGEHYFLNNKNDDDFKNAVDWFEKSAMRRNVKAMEMLTEIYDGRYPAFKNDQKRREWLEKLVETPNAGGDKMMLLADLYKKQKDVLPETIFALYERASQKGNIDAYVALGNAYQNGIGTPRVPVKALRFFRIAASNGNTDAINHLKNAYSCGIGISQNPEKSKFWQGQADYYDANTMIDTAYAFLEKPENDAASSARVKSDLTFLAVTREDKEAMILLGLYFKKTGDEANGEKWIKSALDKDKKENSDYAAHAILGDIYLQGRYAPKNTLMGLNFLNAALQKNNADAAEKIGNWHWQKRNLTQAKKFLFLASDQGNLAANHVLSSITLTEKNFPDALKYLKKSADAGDVKALLNLAAFYSDSKTTPGADAVMAAYWMDKAVKAPPCNSDDILFVAQSYAAGKNGVPQDGTQAGIWLDRALSNEDGKNLYYSKIAEIIFYSGVSFEKPVQDKFIAALKNATKSGNAEAVSVITKLYLDKKIEPDGSFEPSMLLAEKAKSGDVKSMVDLAKMHLSGYGADQSYARGVALLENAANAGSFEAKELLRAIKH